MSCARTSQSHGIRAIPLHPESLLESAAPKRRVSLLTHAPAVVVTLILIANLGQSTDPDLWGHIMFGQTMIASHRVVSRDVYSYSALGKPWHDHEWLAEVLMAVAYDKLGVTGLKLWKATCAGVIILCVADAMAETGASLDIQLGLLGVAASGLMAQLQFRPQIFTFALFAAEIAILTRDNCRRSARLWILLPMMAVWANLHGGFIVGVATLGIYALVSVTKDLIGGKRRRRAGQLCLVFAAAAMATLLTPFGVRTWYPVVHALRNPATRSVIADWRPLASVVASQWSQDYAIGVLGPLCIIGAFALSITLAPHGDDLPLIAIAAMMTLAAMLAVRNMALAIIACAVPTARHISLISGERRDGGVPRSEATAGFFRIGQWFVLAISLAAGAYAGTMAPRLATDSPYPSGAAAFMKRHRLEGNVLADFEWGEYLIWYLSPASKVFIDGRYDTVFSAKIIDDYLNLTFISVGVVDARRCIRIRTTSY